MAVRTADIAIRPPRVACVGRALHVRTDGTLYISRQYRIYRSTDDGGTWTPMTELPCGALRRAAQLSRLASRLLRQEVKALNVLSEGTLVACSREWVYHGRPGEAEMSRCMIEAAGQRVMPPMTLTVGPNDRVLWGEYDSRVHDRPVRLYVSDDRGRSYRIARVFERGEIKHLHNLVYDAGLRQYWVLAGDHEQEPGIGRLSEDLRDFEWVRKGEQSVRAVEVFDFGDRLIYATDTERERNALMSMDKASGRLERLREFDGSCIYACRFGGLCALTTSVEPSEVNRATDSELWLSRDGEQWDRVFAARKDRWNGVYFQFGSIVLPRGASARETIVFSGQALEGIDGKVMVAEPAREA